jgi:hypothetical protein
MSIGKRLGITCVALLALVAALGTGSALASRTVTIGSAISIGSAGLRFHGKVSSPNSACAEDRKVVLYKAVQGGPDEAFGHAKTDRNGRWSIQVSGFAGVSLTPFYAKAPRRSEGAAGTIYVCSAARSKTIKLGS